VLSSHSDPVRGAAGLAAPSVLCCVRNKQKRYRSADNSCSIRCDQVPPPELQHAHSQSIRSHSTDQATHRLVPRSARFGPAVSASRPLCRAHDGSWLMSARSTSYVVSTMSAAARSAALHTVAGSPPRLASCSGSAACQMHRFTGHTSRQAHSHSHVCGERWGWGRIFENLTCGWPRYTRTLRVPGLRWRWISHAHCSRMGLGHTMSVEPQRPPCGATELAFLAAHAPHTKPPWAATRLSCRTHFACCHASHVSHWRSTPDPTHHRHRPTVYIHWRLDTSPSSAQKGDGCRCVSNSARSCPST